MICCCGVFFPRREDSLPCEPHPPTHHPNARSPLCPLLTGEFPCHLPFCTSPRLWHIQVCLFRLPKSIAFVADEFDPDVFDDKADAEALEARYVPCVCCAMWRCCLSWMRGCVSSACWAPPSAIYKLTLLLLVVMLLLLLLLFL